MSTEKHPIDDLFRSKLENFSLEAPDHVWKNIESSRTPLQKAINYFKGKRGMMVGITMLVTAGIGAAWLGSNATQPIAQQPAQPSGEIVATTAPIAETSASKTTTVATGNTANTVTAGQVNTDAVSNTNTSATSSALPNNGNTSNAHTNSAGSNGNNSAAIEDSNPGNVVTNEDNNNSTDNSGKEIFATSADDAALNTLTDVAVADASPDAPVVLAVDAVVPPATEETDAVAKQNNTAQKPAYIPSKFSVDMYALTGLAGRSLSANGASADYLGAKQQAEKFTMGYGAGLRLNYNINNMLSVRVGLQYTRINESFNFNCEYTTTNTIIVTSYIRNAAQQIIGTSTDTVKVKETKTTQASGTNHYNFVDVPVQLEVKLLNARKFSLFATGGAAVNLRFSQSGQFINTDLRTTSEISPANNPYKTNAGVSLLAGVGAEYKVCSHFSALLEAGYRHGLNSVYKSDAGLNQTFRMYNISAGVRYRF